MSSLQPYHPQRLETGAVVATETNPLFEQAAPVRNNNRNNNNRLASSAAFAAQDVQEASSVQQAPRSQKEAVASLVSRLFAPSSSLSSSMQRSSSSASVPRSRCNRPPSVIHTTRKSAPLLTSSSSLRSLDSTAAPWNRFRRSSTETSGSTFQSISSRSFRRLGSDYNTNTDEEVVLFETMHQTRAPLKVNVVQWLSTECPTDVLPHVLSFCGPQMTRKLQGVNRFWNKTIQTESTWKVMCQDLYKWNPGEAEPKSWKEFYCQRPCVPIDYKSVHEALNSAFGEDIHVLMRPGRYYLNESFVVNRLPHQKVTLSTMKLPNNLFKCPPASMLDDGSVYSFATSPATHQQSKKRKGTGSGLLKFIMCTTASYNDAAVDDEEASIMSEHFTNNIPDSPKRATLVLRTRRQNEPAIRVLRGHFCAYNINVDHSSHGVDIWNGNAAIQIQPDPDLPDERPVACLVGIRVTSRTGRGVVTIDGGQLTLKQSKVQECAATGVYIGGRGTRARVIETDVVRNGVGSQRGASRRGGGIARGHSGIYLEQGVADILNCNVSNNTLTGITAVSHENSTLNLRQCDLLGNGSFQLEIPARNARGINMYQNRLESSGTGRIRADI